MLLIVFGNDKQNHFSYYVHNLQKGLEIFFLTWAMLATRMSKIILQLMSIFVNVILLSSFA